MEPSLSPDEIDALFALADLGVQAGLHGEHPSSVDPETLLPGLREPQGVFVTLEVAGELNGCIGSVVARQPLGVAVPELAWRAAFADPRLPPLTTADYPSLEYKLSLIGPLQPVAADSEVELAAHLEVGVDGVLIRDGSLTATFLPAVWQKIPDPTTFLRHLEAKAGLRPGAWPRGIQAWRYRSTELRRQAADIDHRSAA